MQVCSFREVHPALWYEAKASEFSIVTDSSYFIVSRILHYQKLQRVLPVQVLRARPQHQQVLVQQLQNQLLRQVLQPRRKAHRPAWLQVKIQPLPRRVRQTPLRLPPYNKHASWSEKGGLKEFRFKHMWLIYPQWVIVEVRVRGELDWSWSHVLGSSTSSTQLDLSKSSASAVSTGVAGHLVGQGIGAAGAAALALALIWGPSINSFHWHTFWPLSEQWREWLT